MPIRVEVLGGIRAYRSEGVALRFRTRSTALLLAFLALHPDQDHPRGELAQRFWPGSSQEQKARQSLSMALSAFRAELAEEFETVFRITPITVGMRATAVLCDARELEVYLAQKLPDRRNGLEEALALYRGELALGFNEPSYERPWLEEARTRFARLQQLALVELATLHEQQGEVRAASVYILQVTQPELLSATDQAAYLRLAALATAPERVNIPLLREGAALAEVSTFEQQLTQLGEAPLGEERQLLRRMLSELVARLPERERRLLVALSLFHGNFSLTLVEAATEFAQCKQLCRKLRKKHLLQASELGKDRYVLSSAVRELVAPLLEAKLRQRYLRRIACWFAAQLYWNGKRTPASSLKGLYQPLLDEDATLQATLQAHLDSGDSRELSRATWLVFYCHMYWELLGRSQERFEWLWRIFQRQSELPNAYLPRLWTHQLDSMGGCVDPAKWLPEILKRLPELERRVDRKLVGLLLMTAGYYAHHAERNEQALALFEAGLPRIEASTLSEKVQLARLLCDYSETLQIQGFPERALQCCEKALQLVEGYEEIAAMEQLYSELLLHQGRLKEAEKLVEKSLHTLFPHARPSMQELALRKQGNIYVAQGRFGLAAVAFQHALLLCQQIGAREPASDCQRGLGTIHLYQGQLVHAKLHFEEGIVVWRELNHHRWQVLFLHLLARVALQQGDLVALQAYLDEAQAHLMQTRSPGADAYALWLQAELAVEQGDLHRAIELHREALALRLRFSPKHLQMESQDSLAYILERLGQHEEALQLRQSVAQAREAFCIRETDYRTSITK